MDCWRDRNGSCKIFICSEKGMSRCLWCLFKTSLQALLFPLPFPALLSVSWIKSDQRSGIIFLPLSYNTPHSSAILKYKLKRQESSKAFPYVSVGFQTEVKGRRPMYTDVSKYSCLLKYISQLQIHFSFSKCSSGELLLATALCSFNGWR